MLVLNKLPFNVVLLRRRESDGILAFGASSSENLLFELLCVESKHDGTKSARQRRSAGIETQMMPTLISRME